MRTLLPLSLLIVLAVTLPVFAGEGDEPASLIEQRERLLKRLETVHGLSSAQLEALRAIFARSPVLGQGNPKIARHPMSVGECLGKIEKLKVDFDKPAAERICGDRYMAPLYDPHSESPAAASACIDRFEFPNIPCEFPVVWVRAGEAAAICEAVGKRLCDAHEWEGACAGRLEEADYRFDLAAGQSMAQAVTVMRSAHNRERAAAKAWSYGPEYRAGVCAAASEKSSGCGGGSWSQCGSNTYPAGAFPECRSELGVFDLHGNAAEHMNLPLDPSQLASRGSAALGVTEMKGSWFIFDRYYAHEDWCRWRAPFWHGSRVRDPQSHHNYHLGFRCCKTIEAADAGSTEANR